jgi:hypothetical protein
VRALSIQLSFCVTHSCVPLYRAKESRCTTICGTSAHHMYGTMSCFWIRRSTRNEVELPLWKIDRSNVGFRSEEDIRPFQPTALNSVALSFRSDCGTTREDPPAAFLSCECLPLAFDDYFLRVLCRFSGRRFAYRLSIFQSLCPVTSATCSIENPASNSRLVASCRKS